MNDTAPHRVVVIGGGYAGLTTAARIGEQNSELDLTLIDAKPQFVERIRLHEIATGSHAGHLPYAEFMTARNRRFVEARVSAVDAGSTGDAAWRRGSIGRNGVDRRWRADGD